MGVKVQFGTLSDYFSAVAADIEQNNIEFPVYNRDFFPYADNEDSYWTGYYTTRPTLKSVSRELTSLLRTSQLFFSFTRDHLRPRTSNALFDKLDIARSNAGLFLHHDAITGTAKSHVVDDYLSRMHQAMQFSLETLAKSISVDLGANADFLKEDGGILNAGGVNRVVVLNSLLWHREEVVCVLSPKHIVSVYDSDGKVVPSQVDVDFLKPDMGNVDSAPKAFQVCFHANVPALGYSTFFIDVRSQKSDLLEPSHAASLSSMEFHHTEATKSQSIPTVLKDFGVQLHEMSANQRERITIGNQRYTLRISSSTGLLEAIKLNSEDGFTTFFHSFREFSTHSSGAYIFRPNGDSKELKPVDVLVRISRGQLYEQAQVHHGSELLVSYRLIKADIKTAHLFEISESVVAQGNQELVTRFDTEMGQGDDSRFDFMTHNGVEFIPRPIRHSSEASSIQSSFFPTVMGARMQSSSSRLSIFSSHTTAGSSPAVGSVEFMVHRHLLQDDGRGLAQAVQDGSRIRVKFSLLLETSSQTVGISSSRWFAYLNNHAVSILGGLAASSSTDIAKCEDDLVCSRSFLHPDFATLEDLHITALQPTSSLSDDIHIIVQNLNAVESISFDLASLLSSDLILVDTIRETSLTGVYGNHFVLLISFHSQNGRI
jgi:alpha-mannosidase II